MKNKKITLLISLILSAECISATSAHDAILDVKKFPDLSIVDACPVLKIKMVESKIDAKLTWPPKIYIQGRDIITVLTEWKKKNKNTVLIIEPDSELLLKETLNYLKQIRSQTGIRFFMIDDGKSEFFFELSQ